MEVKSTSKINIGLHVHNKRSDGFHNISTLFQEIDLCDKIKIIEDKKFSCTTNCSTIIEKDNFGTKAFNLMKAQYPDMPNVRISIKK
jgi:4-diphosphocytidyl-2C-methyl-D-erythritol 2-phosphate synthase